MSTFSTTFSSFNRGDMIIGLVFAYGLLDIMFWIYSMYTIGSLKKQYLFLYRMFTKTAEAELLYYVRLFPNVRELNRAYGDSAGIDVFAYDSRDEKAVYSLQPGERALVRTGIQLCPPEGTYVRVAPRSGLASHGISVDAGVGDRSYRGEYFVLLVNNSSSVFYVPYDKPIAQLILERISNAEVREVGSLDITERGSNGFGSSDIRSDNSNNNNEVVDEQEQQVRRQRRNSRADEKEREESE